MDKNNVINDHDMIIKRLASLTRQEFLNLGTDGLSYIKPVDGQDGKEMYALHSANGSHIATGTDIAALKTIAVDQHLAPMSLQ